jgi:hypothetical protein
MYPLAFSFILELDLRSVSDIYVMKTIAKVLFLLVLFYLFAHNHLCPIVDIVVSLS